MITALTITRNDVLAPVDYTFLSAMLTSEYYLTLMDQLKGSKYYRGYLRNGAKLVAAETEKILREDADVMLGIDDKLVYTLQESYEAVMIQMATIRPEYIGVCAEIIRKFIESPQEVLDMFDLKAVSTTGLD